MENRIEVGAWYDWVRCRNCGTLLAMFEALRDAPVSENGNFVFHDVPCDNCGQKHDYRRNDFARVQAQALPKQPTIH